MPSDAPKSLRDSEVQALGAYLLGEAGLHPKAEVMDATSVIAIEMANENGFVPDRRPDVQSITPTATTP
jgi:cytochrome c